MADALAWVRTSVVAAVPTRDGIRERFAHASGELERYVPALPTASVDALRLPWTQASPDKDASGAAPGEGPTESQFTSMMAARRARIDLLKAEGPRLLHAGNPRRALEACRAWVELDLGNAEAWRCLGQAQEASGQHQEALNSLRKAREHNPSDRSIDAAIRQVERNLVADFQRRYAR